MTKAAEIRRLYAKGYTVKEISAVIGCSEEYVRVCSRQRANGLGKADLKYSAKPEVRAIKLRYYRAYYQRRKAAALQSSA